MEFASFGGDLHQILEIFKELHKNKDKDSLTHPFLSIFNSFLQSPLDYLF